MTAFRLLLRNLSFHRRAHFAVLLGAAVGCAVLAGALLVGDSLRGSLRDRAEAQRGGVDFALVSGKYFNANIFHSRLGTIQTCIIVRGSLRSNKDGDERMISGVTVRSGVQFGSEPLLPNGIVVPQSLANQLNIKSGDVVRLRVVTNGNAPRESLLGQRDLDKSQVEIGLQVQSVVADDNPLAQFRLAPGVLPPRNVLVDRHVLQEKLAGGRDVANAILAGVEWGRFATSLPSGDIGSYETARGMLEAELKKNLTLDDWGVKVESRGDYFTVESRQTLLEPAVADATLRAANGLRTAPTLVYLANRIAAEGREPIPYSVVAALDPAQSPPLGPFTPLGVSSLKDDEIVLADWPDSPLRDTPVGTTITLSYFDPELKDGKQTEETATFKLAGFVAMVGAAADPNLTPAFPGITDKLDIRKWDPPFPYDNTKLKMRDETYWREHKATPKAYVTLAAGQKLWGSRFGNLTSIRLAGERNPMPFLVKLLGELDPKAGGFVFDDVKARFAEASQGGQDFGGLFLGFSFFLIVSALLLVGLLTRLNLERRAGEIGLLVSTGWSVGKVRRMLLLEGAAVATVGGAIGLLGAVGYAAAMLWLFRRLWPDAAASSFLNLHVSPLTLAIGFFGTLMINLLTIVWALRMLSRAAPSRLIAGEFQPAAVGASAKGNRTLRWVITAGFVVALACVAAGYVQGNPTFRAMAFFGGGATLLACGIGLIWLRLKRRGSESANSLWSLGAGNARRNPARSLLTASLLASAAFLLVAVEAFRREPEKDFAQRSGGSGGFSLIAETDIPVYRDLPDEAMLDAIDLHLQRARDDTGVSLVDRKKQARDVLAKTHIYPFRLRPGDDASCLNLYKANRPRLLGVPPSFAAEETRFRFTETAANTPEEKKNPWRLLRDQADDGSIPVFGEENTLMWMFKKGLGDDIDILDDEGKTVKLRIVGVLKDSVFPSELLMASSAFQKIYPRQEGYPYLLVETPLDQSAAVADLLRIGLAKHGPEITLTRDRLASYLAVENTYLTTFQLLGGLGLLLGAVGLAVVLLRGVWERRSELALLRALGYRHRALGLLVFAENGLLLLYGLEIGLFAALGSVVPHLSAGGSLPWPRLIGLLSLIVVSGLLAGLWAVRATLRAPLLPALRRE